MSSTNDSKKMMNNSGVMLNAYPDSIGNDLHDLLTMLKMSAFKNTFSLFYILPTFFNSDLDRGFSIIDYDLNRDLVSDNDLKELQDLGVELKFDIVLNHLSVASPQFRDLLKYGEGSRYKDFFIDWNEFWAGNGKMGEDGVIIPEKEFLDKLFMRKSGLPILKVPFPDGSLKPYWNTFYQQINYKRISKDDLKSIRDLKETEARMICQLINTAIETNQDPFTVDLGDQESHKKAVLNILAQGCRYLGQMDVNANSELVWDFYEDTLKKLSDFGCRILRLDAFAYLHKEIGQSNFFNKPGTWDYLDRIKRIADKHNLLLLPEIHAEYGLNLHDEVAQNGYYIYDFFLPGLTLHTIEKGSNKALLSWINEIMTKKYRTVNMLGCHDGIPVLDLKGKEINGVYNRGLLEDKEIEDIMKKIMDRGGRVKNLYGPSGQKISYYQINATYFSALGEDEQKLLLARAIQMFMPGIPQVWYLDLFAGKNDYEAADHSGSGGHKEINRTTLSLDDVNAGLERDIVKNQLELIRLRNNSKAFLGEILLHDTPENELGIEWRYRNEIACLKANLETSAFSIHLSHNGTDKTMTFQ